MTAILLFLCVLLMFMLTAISYMYSVGQKVIPRRLIYYLSVLPFALCIPLFVVGDLPDTKRMTKLTIAVTYSCLSLFTSVVVADRHSHLESKAWWNRLISGLSFTAGVFYLYVLIGSILFFGFGIE